VRRRREPQPYLRAAAGHFTLAVAGLQLTDEPQQLALCACPAPEPERLHVLAMPSHFSRTVSCLSTGPHLKGLRRVRIVTGADP
jgi:hypothetical protein